MTVQTEDEVRIRAIVTEEKEAAMAARDPERLVARYAPGAVTYDLAPPLRHAGPEVHDADGLRAWFDTFDGPVGYEVHDLSVTVDGDVAFCHSLDRLSATPRGASEAFSMWLRATVCLRRVDDAWRIAHEHESVPFLMDGSFLAATGLEP